MIVEELIAHSDPAISAFVLVFLAVLIYWIRWKRFQQKMLKAFPVAKLDEENINDSIMKAIDKHPNTPFILPTAQSWIILPHKLVNEVKKIPDEESSFMSQVYNRMHGLYTGIGRFDHTEGIAAIRNDLTRNMAKVLLDLQDESSLSVEKEIGDCSQPKEITVYGTMLPIISRVSARIFVGIPLCRDEEWIHATSNLATNIIQAINKITSLSPWVRPFVVPFLPEFRKLVSLNFFFSRKLQPQVTAIVKAYELNKSDNKSWLKPSGETINHHDVTDDNHNLVHWTIRNFKNPERVSAGEIGRVEIGTAFAAILTTSMTLSHILFDIASHPEYIRDLRDEIEAVLLEENNPDQLLRKSSIPKLKKLDSFMKESQRMNPMGMINVPRMVVAKNGITLSTGHSLPYGSFVGFAAPFFTSSNFKSDSVVTDENQPPLNEFAPWRYSELRRHPGHETRHQFVSTDDNEITFGAGRHLCPGRFFASNEIKVILVELLMKYDISLGPEGQGAGQDGYERPILQEQDTLCSPDATAKIWIRNRQR